MRYIKYKQSSVYHIAGRTEVVESGATSENRIIPVCNSSFYVERFKQDTITTTKPKNTRICSCCKRKLDGIITDDRVNELIFLDCI